MSDPPVRARVSIEDPRRVVVTQEPWRSILERAQHAMLDPDLDQVIKTYERNQRRARRE